MALTFSELLEEARTLLQDKLPTSGGVLRYSDQELFECINSFMLEVRTKRPDLFLTMGLRTPIPFYSYTADLNTAFPLDPSAWSAFVYYIVGRSELREDTFSDDGRAVAMLNKATSQLLTIQS